MLGRGDGQLERAGYLLPAQPADRRVPINEAEVVKGPVVIKQKTL